ncbi:MAG: hypothetical protein LBP59_14360 [Planctomycetaceae bacterium]|nr:hypothetical protein [Planctomycetaceae bacterium]
MNGYIFVYRRLPNFRTVGFDAFKSLTFKYDTYILLGGSKNSFFCKKVRCFAAVFIFWAAMEFMIPINFNNS